MSPLFRSNGPLDPPPRGSLGDEEYRQLLELHERSATASPEQALSFRRLKLGGQPWAMYAVQAIMAASYFLIWRASGGGDIGSDLAARFGGIDLAHLAEGQTYRMITASFLHTQFINYLFDAWFLFSAGKLVERTIGPAPFLFIFLVTGACGAALIQHRGLDIASTAGSSVFGVIGAMIGIYLRYRRSLHAMMRSALLGFVPLLVIYGIMAFVQPLFDISTTLAGVIPGIVLPILLPRTGIFRADGAEGRGMQWSLVAAMSVFVAIAYGMLLSGAKLAVGPIELGQTFRHPDGWSIQLPSGYEGDVVGKGAQISHPTLRAVYGINYSRDLVGAGPEEALATMREEVGIGAGQKEKVKDTFVLGGQRFAFLAVETPDSSLASEYLAGEEIMRTRPLYFSFTAPTAGSGVAHETLLRMVETFEQR